MKVGIVVVTYNRLSLLKEAINSLRNQTFLDIQIIVINNSSNDGTLEWLETQTDIKTITQPNSGGAGGFFSGMKYVAENHFDYCWVMDDDVICQPDALQELIFAYTKKEKIGFVCSKVIGIDGCPMNTPTVDDRATANGCADYTDLISESMIKVKTATFVSIFCSIDVIKKVGLPYKEFFIWGDDTEYTTRISQSYDCYMACKSIVVHKRSIQKELSFESETNPERIKMFFYKIRNEVFTELKYKPLLKNKSFRINFFFNLYKRVISLYLHGKKTQATIMLKAILSLRNFHPRISFPKE